MLATKAKTLKEFEANLDSTLEKAIRPMVVQFLLLGVIGITYLFFKIALIKWLLSIVAFFFILSVLTLVLTFFNLKKVKKTLLKKEHEEQSTKDFSSTKDTEWTDF